MREPEPHPKTQGGQVTLPSGTVVRLGRLECEKCGALLGFFGGTVISGAIAVRIRCGEKRKDPVSGKWFECRHENILTVEAA